MAMRPPVGAPTLSRRTRILLIVAAVIILLLLGGSRLLNLYVDWLWFGEVGFREVFTTLVFTHVPAVPRRRGCVIGRAGRAVAVDRLPLASGVRADQRAPRTRRPYRTVIIPAAAASSASAFRWCRLHRRPGRAERLADRPDVPATPRRSASPIREFNIDVSFYMFHLPIIRSVLDWLFVAVAICFVAALVTQYLFGGIRLTGRPGQITSRAQLAVLVGVFVLLKAVEYWYDRYELLFSNRSDTFTGASYTDINAVMPAKLILMFIAVICASGSSSAVFRRNSCRPSPWRCWCSPAC